MTKAISRRALLAAAGLGAASGIAGTAAAEESKVLIVGVSCSPRKGMTTAIAMAAALEAAAGVSPRIVTELIDLGGMKISGSDGSSSSGGAAGLTDDFEKIVPILESPNLGGMMIGSPCYYRSLSSLCKAFLERLAIFRAPVLRFADLPVGALSVGAYRNGGQELVIDQILTAMLCHEAMLVGGKPRAHQGATLWNGFNNDITKDELGMESARHLGVRVAEAALKLKG
ncbi:MAG TPA: flavodoxin family protein [Candidatus Hydrogenedentes bacterium]|nr:flavodoxin family protein [Candidatus Hydrogenedentota bacterium]